MATEEEVAEQRARTDAARAALRSARVQAQMGGATAVAEVNDHKLEALKAEEAALAAELRSLTGATEEAPPAAPAEEAPAAPAEEAPAEEATEAPAEDTPADPSTSGTGRTRR